MVYVDWSLLIDADIAFNFNWLVILTTSLPSSFSLLFE